MSMSTHVVAFRPADARWHQMKAAWDACDKAKVPVPDDVQAFFDFEYPGDKPGMEIDLSKSGAVKEWSRDSANGYEIEVAMLPKEVSVIRVYNSY